MNEEHKNSKDKLERFVIDHRSEFDHIDPPEVIWDHISSEIRRKKPVRTSVLDWVWRVAAILFFGLSVYLIFDKVTQTGSGQYRSIVSSESIYEEFENTEQYYSKIIQVKRQELNSILGKENPLNIDFNKDLMELDSMYTLLKNDFQVNNDELVLDAMIKNLQLRIEILDKQLNIINDLNTLKEKKDEGITI